ncbi:Gag protease polyprotein [Gossypium australe]|uniref:Gag protease polyprotein n=1 Tax=Gossypium australe TaxID=47621 RepID=A0A5B6UWS3_9ROSI|nr:Gag protease polyprotein [Gossypium australe]
MELYWWPGLKREVTDFVKDRLTKSTHFLPVHTKYFLQKLAKLYILKIVKLHGVLVSIISYWDPRFLSRFWKKLHEALGNRLDFSTTSYPQTDGQPKRVIQILQDILRSYIIESRDKWEENCLELNLPIIIASN